MAVPHMGKVFIFALALQPSYGFAADIAEIASPFLYIQISGNIEKGDFDKFKIIADRHTDAEVMLDGNSGDMEEAIKIGKLINSKSYKTVVWYNSDCLSPCSLIWMSGLKRSISDSGTIRFEYKYNDVDLLNTYFTDIKVSQSDRNFIIEKSENEKILYGKNKNQGGVNFTPLPYISGFPREPDPCNGNSKSEIWKANRWRFLDSSTESAFFIDSKSLLPTKDSTLRLCRLEIYKNSPNNISYSVQYTEVDCEDLSFHPVNFTNYYANGAKWSIGGYDQWHEPEKGSLAESVSLYACGRRKDFGPVEDPRSYAPNVMGKQLDGPISGLTWMQAPNA